MCRERRTVNTILSIYKVDAGCTCPVLVKLDNESRAVLKYPRNPQGMVVLLNEYITGHLAKVIGLTTPHFGIAVVDDNTTLDTNLSSGLSLENFRGIGFYSEYIPKTAPVSARALRHATNLNETAKIILLDHIVKNCDRHVGNLLITTNLTDPVIYAIDHSHAFGDPDWNIADLSLNDIASPYIWRENMSMYNMLISAGALVTPEQLDSERCLIQAHITSDFLNNVFASIPSEWVNIIGSENVSHLRQYISNRVENLEAICNMINQERGV